MKQIDAAASRSAAAEQNSCLTCRDFSAPDKVAATYPRTSLPRDDPTGYLARVLCGPFPSATDKARAIFTWFHHNIAYDLPSFLGNRVSHKTAEQTIDSGLAVCSGYAETYKAIATKAGLDCVMVVGHGKGAGYRDLKKGERPPPRDPTGHAWNAVRIDGGEWKLLDACWGAGNVCLAQKKYTPSFKPHEFTSSNEVLGQKHYPENPAYFFRKDRRIPTWEEYIIGPFQGERPLVYANAYQEGIDEYSISPQDRQLSVHSGEIVRFQFSKVCAHWTAEKNGLGKAGLLLLCFHGLDGRKDEMVPLETDGYWWWLDVNARDLGAPGQTVSVNVLSKFDGRDARGLTVEEFRAKFGRCGWGSMGICQWELV
jgi:Transglutaminase-like superfamily